MSQQKLCEAVINLPSEMYSNGGIREIGTLSQKKNARYGSLLSQPTSWINNQSNSFLKCKTLSSVVLHNVSIPSLEHDYLPNSNSNSDRKAAKKEEMSDREIIELSDISDFDLNDSSCDDDDDESLHQ